MLFCFARCEWPDIRNELRVRGLWPDRDRAAPAVNPATVAQWRAERQRVDHQRIDAAVRLWASGRAITNDDPAGRYLASRGLPGLWPATLHYVPCARHPSGANVPALIAAACRWPDRAPVAVQLTALTPNGRQALVEPIRWTRGVLRGAAVRLAPWSIGHALVLVEGIEDGLAALQALPHAVPWAVLGASNVADVALPEDSEVLLALDGDDAGRKASGVASATLMARGHRVRVAVLAGGGDLNQLLVAPATVSVA